MQCTASLATEVFDQYIITRLGIIAARFEHKIDSVNKNVGWKWSLLDFYFRNIFCDTQRLTSILKADIWAAIQLGLNEIEAQLFSLMGEFQQKLLGEASTLVQTQLQMFTLGLCDHDRGASALCHCQAKQQDKLAEGTFFKGGPTPCIHDALIELPLHTVVSRTSNWSGEGHSGQLISHCPKDKTGCTDWQLLQCHPHCMRYCTICCRLYFRCSQRGISIWHIL